MEKAEEDGDHFKNDQDAFYLDGFRKQELSTYMTARVLVVVADKGSGKEAGWPWYCGRYVGQGLTLDDGEEHIE